jgi:flavin reductase (DIM6/NTAB) family NADH-FMN oxidoreductase RutF
MSSPFDLVDCPVFALTCRHEDREDAMIATWVMSVTLIESRSRVLATLTPGHLSTELITASKRFAVHLLAEGQHELIPRLGLHSGRDGDKLKSFDALSRTHSGLAIIPGTCGWAECEVLSSFEVADRVILAATVRDERQFSGKRPLTISAAYRALPKSVVEACEAQRRRDGAVDNVV